MDLIVFAHPNPNTSHANQPILNAIRNMDGIVISDLYEKYPDFHIHILEEQELLLQAQHIYFQFPIYWYNVPAILKQWQEMVLTRGFAFGKTDPERQLKGKTCQAVVTTGHKRSSYQDGGYDSFSLDNFLRPLEQMADHCHMNYQPPLVLHQAHRAQEKDLHDFIFDYKQSIKNLRQA